MPFLSSAKLLFIHIPKTGGTSVEHFFDMCQRECFWFDRWDQDMNLFLDQRKHQLSDEVKSSYEPQHYPPHILKKLIPDYNDYFKFTIVRHPYTRILSEYFWQQSMLEIEKKDFDPGEFHVWVEAFLQKIDTSHKEKQSFYLQEHYDFLGRFEFLESDIEKLLKILIDRNPYFTKFKQKPFPAMNQTSKNKEQMLPYIEKRTKEMIFNTYEEDFRLLNYLP